MLLVTAAMAVSFPAMAGPPAVTGGETVVRTSKEYSTDLALSKYGESVDLIRVAVKNATTTNATVYLEFLDTMGVESIQNATVNAGAVGVLYPARTVTVSEAGWVVTNNVPLQVTNVVSTQVPVNLQTLRIRTVLTATNHTGSLSYSVTVK